MSCVTCSKEVKGFRDPLSIREYKISGMCQDCQDNVFGAEEKSQICEECGRHIPIGEEVIMSNYAVCSDKCAMSLVGL